MDSNHFKSAYQKISRIKRNDYYLGLVQDLFCGKEGKVCSFLQFSYQNNILSPFGSEFCKLFSALAKEEIYHFQVLSEIIVSLGGDPVLTDNQGRWFSGRWLDYVKDIKQMLSINIESKEKSVIDYRTVISKVDDMFLKQALGQILKEEQNILKQLKDSLEEIS